MKFRGIQAFYVMLVGQLLSVGLMGAFQKWLVRIN